MERQMRTVLYPGTFDPVTNGHLDIISRSCGLFDRVYVGIAGNEKKKPLFSLEDRIALMKKACGEFGNVEVISFDGLLVHAVNVYKVTAVIRGIRAVADFEYEFQMALMNHELNQACETIFMMPSKTYSFVSSKLIKEVARCGGDISSFVPENVKRALELKIEQEKL
jgi:pantetheine-phosphate adenylyltransferase